VPAGILLALPFFKEINFLGPIALSLGKNVVTLPRFFEVSINLAAFRQIEQPRFHSVCTSFPV
jgi:hypothetical protein